MTMLTPHVAETSLNLTWRLLFVFSLSEGHPGGCTCLIYHERTWSDHMVLVIASKTSPYPFILIFVWTWRNEVAWLIALEAPSHPQVVCIATTAQEKMNPWKETSRSFKISTSSRRGLAATPSRLPVKAACIYVSFPHFDYCKDYVDVSDIWCNRLLFPFYIMIWARCDDVQLCNCCVRELLILARTWFAFGLPSKTGCDNNLIESRKIWKGTDSTFSSLIIWKRIPYTNRRPTKIIGSMWYGQSTSTLMRAW
jgi:hypothetical protein